MRRSVPTALLVTVVLALSALAATPRTAVAEFAACPDISGPRCIVDLSTGITMAYLETGPADGHVVVLLHGWTDSVRSWSPSMAALHTLRPDLRLIALDFRGHGGSSMPQASRCPGDPGWCFQRKDMAADVVAFMDARSIRTATVVGHSMGSFVAEELGLNHRERVERIVLLGSGLYDRVTSKYLSTAFLSFFQPWQDNLTARGYRWPDDVYNLTPLDADPDAVEWMKAFWTIDPIATTELTDAIAVDAASTRLGTFLGPVMANEHPDVGRLRSLAVPALILWGSQDPFYWFEPEERRLIEALGVASRGAGSFSWKQYGVIPLPDTFAQTDDIGHAIQWEAPAEVAHDIDAFLRTGQPTLDRYRSGAPDAIQTIVTEPGLATIITAP